MSDGVNDANDLLEKAVSGDSVALTVLLTRVHETLRAHERGDQRFAESATALLDHIEAAGRTPSRSVAAHEGVRLMQQAITVLPPDQAEAVRLVYMEGGSVQDAARALGRTERAVHNLCFKAKERLREMLGEQAGWSSGASP